MLGNALRWRTGRSVTAVTAALLVAACGMVMPRPVEAPLTALYPPIDFPFADPPVPRSRPAVVPPLPAEPEVAAPENTDLPADFSALVGAAEPDVAMVLGEPDWFEDVPPARMWQYASTNCVVRLYFFMELSTRNFRVLSYELESGHDGDDAEQQCFSEFVRGGDAGSS